MRSHYSSAIAGVTLGIVFSVANPVSVLAETYSSRQFVDVLWGLGYSVDRGQSLTDANVRRALQQFQRDYGLPVTGSVGSLTDAKATTIIRNLRYSLNVVIKPDPPLSTQVPLYADRVEEVVRQFQRRYRLAVTGRADLQTRQTLRNLVSPDELPSAGQEPPEQSPIPSPSQSPGASQYTALEFRAALNGIGYPVPRSGSLTDNQTTAAIGLFQRDYQLSVNFTADEATQTTLATTIRNLRNNLKIIVSPELPVSPFYDAETEAAIVQFQRRYNLQVTGIADLTTRRTLNQLATSGNR